MELCEMTIKEEVEEKIDTETHFLASYYNETDSERQERFNGNDDPLGCCTSSEDWTSDVDSEPELDPGGDLSAGVPMAGGEETGHQANENKMDGGDLNAVMTRAGSKRKRRQEKEAETTNRCPTTCQQNRTNTRAWSKSMSKTFTTWLPAFQTQPLKPLPATCLSPYDFHRLFVDDDFIDRLATTSRQYAMRKKIPADVVAKITSDNLRLSVAIMYMTGYLRPANQAMFWEQREDTMNTAARKAMARNTFRDILRTISFVVPKKKPRARAAAAASAEATDQLWKVLPLFEQLNRTARQYVCQSAKVTVDCVPVRMLQADSSDGDRKRHIKRQKVSGRPPSNFGDKIWLLVSSAGELLSCLPLGQDSSCCPIGDQCPSAPVLELIDQFGGLSPGTRIYGGHACTSIHLMDSMEERGLGLTVVLDPKRQAGLPLPTPEEVSKRFKRGRIQVAYAGNSLVAVWQGAAKQPVYMASNSDKLTPVTVHGRQKQEHSRKVLPQPNLIAQHRQAMGAVDLFSNCQQLYSITAIMSRKRLYCGVYYAWFLNTCMVQAWRLYRAHMRHAELVKLKAMDEVKLEAMDEVKQEAMDDEEGVDNYNNGEEMDNDNEEEEIDKNNEEEEMDNGNEQEEEEYVDDTKTGGSGSQISLLEFTRQVVEATLQKHNTQRGSGTVMQLDRVTTAALETVRYDSGRHLIQRSGVKGVCKLCRGRSHYRCSRCGVALHPDCFHRFHVPKAEADEQP